MLALRLRGYSLDDPAAAIRAFHLHYRGIDNMTLGAEDASILHALIGEQPEQAAQGGGAES